MGKGTPPAFPVGNSPVPSQKSPEPLHTCVLVCVGGLTFGLGLAVAEGAVLAAFGLAFALFTAPFPPRRRETAQPVGRTFPVAVQPG